MADNLDNVPELEQQPSADSSVDPETLDLSGIPDELPVEDVKGLKSTLEKLKAQLAELKPLKAKASILDELTTQGIDPSQIPAKLAELQRQQQTKEEVERQIAQIRAQETAAQEEQRQVYEGQIAKLAAEIQANQKQKALESVLAIAGGSASDYNDFSSIASRFIEFDESQQIKNFKDVDGKTLYVNDPSDVGKVRPATAYDFVVEVKKGKYGRALQAIVPALNQSAGSGIPSGPGIGGDGILRLTQAELNTMGSWPANDPRLKAVRQNKYQIIG